MEGLKGFFTKETAGLPNWAWAGVILVGVGAGILFMRSQSSKSSTPAAAPTTPSTDTTTDLAANSSDGQLGSSPVYVLATSPTGDTDTGTTPPTTPTPPPSTSTTLMIRQKTPKDPASSKQTGIPFFSAPGSGKISDIPFGTSVTTTGLAISGPNNNPSAGASHGSTQWYPITYQGKSGYISAYDIVGTGGGPDRYPVGLNSFFMPMEV